MNTPVLGFAAYSGTGKTTLLTKLIPILKSKGVKVAVIKHSHHDVELDTPGKDSYELRKSGAIQTVLASPGRWSLVTEIPGQAEPSLQAILSQLNLKQLDLVLVEGFRDDAIAKIELHRNGLDKPFLYTRDNHIIALATDNIEQASTELPVLDLNNPENIAEFVLTWMEQQ